MSQLCWLLVPFWKHPLGGEAEPLGHGVGPQYRTKVEAQNWVPQQRSTMGHTDGEMGWRRERLDKADEDAIRSLLESMKQAVEKKAESNGCSTNVRLCQAENKGKQSGEY